MGKQKLIALDEFIKNKSDADLANFIKQLEEQEAYEICAKINKCLKDRKKEVNVTG